MAIPTRKARTSAEIALSEVRRLDNHSNPCYESTRVPVDGRMRCPQCWKYRPHPKGFIGIRGKPIQVCTFCSKKRKIYNAEYRAKQLSKVSQHVHGHNRHSHPDTSGLLDGNGQMQRLLSEAERLNK